MADHRKSFRPRRLAFDGRLLPRGRRIGVALALLGALSTPAFAQDLGLKNGAKSLAAGKYETAVRQLSATVNDEKATPSEAAQALMLRGIAYRKAGQPARGIVDLGAAVWLGLPASDKVRALVNKGLAYKAAGLSSQGDAELAQARKISSTSTVDKLIAQDGGATVAGAESSDVVASDESSSGESVWSRLVPSFGGSTAEPSPAPAPAAEPPPTRTAEAAPKSGWKASVSDEQSSSSSGSTVSRWFGSLTGDSAPAPAAPTPAPSAALPPRTTAAPKSTAAPPSAASWAANTETEKVVSNEGGSSTAIGRWFSRQTESSPSAPAAQQAASGGYTVQLANSRSQAEAQALWKKVQQSNQQLASAAPQIEKVDIGNFGTFYSLKIGPFASQAEGTKLCNALKRGGTDCSVISPDGP